MRAVWYDRQGPAVQVLQAGELPPPEPGPGEVRVRLTRSGVNPGDTKKRRGWLGSVMPFPRVIPHSDGAGVVESVGEGADATRVGRRVWVYGAQSYRPSGTAAQLTIEGHRSGPVPGRIATATGNDGTGKSAAQWWSHGSRRRAGCRSRVRCHADGGA